jgi:hypothetical protein
MAVPVAAFPDEQGAAPAEDRDQMGGRLAGDRNPR